MAEAQFISDPLVIRWQSKLLKKAKSTARVYGEFLFTYFDRVLRPRGLTLSGWLDELKTEAKSDDTDNTSNKARNSVFTGSYMSDSLRFEPPFWDLGSILTEVPTRRNTGLPTTELGCSTVSSSTS